MTSIWVLQVAVLCVVIVAGLGCTPAQTPCVVDNTVPRIGFNNFKAECTGKKGVFPPEETCTIEHGDGFTLDQDSCDTAHGTLVGRPMIIDDAEVFPKGNVSFHCSDTGILSASDSDGSEIDGNVKTLDCYSQLFPHACPVAIEDGITEKIGLDSMLCGGGQCTPIDGQQFSVPKDACNTNGYNRPLVLNGVENPAAMLITEDTVFQCRDTALASSGSATVADVNSIACGTSCPYRMMTDYPGTIGCGASGTGPIDCILTTTVNGVLENNLCPAGVSTVTVIDENDNTIKGTTTGGDVFNFQCTGGRLTIVHNTGAALVQTYPNVKSFQCA